MESRTVLLIWFCVLVAVVLGLTAHWRLRHIQMHDVAKALWGFTILLFPITGRS